MVDFKWKFSGLETHNGKMCVKKSTGNMYPKYPTIYLVIFAIFGLFKKITFHHLRVQGEKYFMIYQSNWSLPQIIHYKYVTIDLKLLSGLKLTSMKFRIIK